MSEIYEQSALMQAQNCRQAHQEDRADSDFTMMKVKGVLSVDLNGKAIVSIPSIDLEVMNISMAVAGPFTDEPTDLIGYRLHDRTGAEENDPAEASDISTIDIELDLLVEHLTPLAGSAE